MGNATAGDRELIRRALAISPASSARDRTADITTTGARTGRLRRIEIWFYRFEDRIYLSGLPGRRGWLANLAATPRLTFHLKNGVQADLPATARIVTDEQERRRAFTHFVADLNQPHDPARIGRKTSVEDWMAGSPLVEVLFDDSL
ncbi:nitroreductase/quinone reductase family protein [Actinoplanes sp. M2I2]|uniref:nitroreductase/quinone reductase family protein n=1 Tax=Actinoplanes sp. M2I2 TaxID=1734444 RepID=UPI002021A15A|nr:nitroreductase/quinone reductase family protein [Actinoplanes sp. M2I2]